MDRRGFFARAAAAIAGVFAACVGTGTPSFAAPVPTALPPRVSAIPSDADPIWGEFVDQMQAHINAQVAADTVRGADGMTSWDFPLDAESPRKAPAGKFTLRSWRPMTHPRQATAEERRLAALSWEKPAPADDGLDDWVEWPYG